MSVVVFTSLYCISVACYSIHQYQPLTFIHIYMWLYTNSFLYLAFRDEISESGVWSILTIILIIIIVITIMIICSIFLAAKDLVSHLMEPDPDKRFTCSEALVHPWWVHPTSHLLSSSLIGVSPLCALSSQLSFDQDTRVDATLTQTPACQYMVAFAQNDIRLLLASDKVRMISMTEHNIKYN